MHKIYFILLFAAVLFFAGCNVDKSDQFADTIYTNGKIYTVNENQPWAEAIAVKDGKFIKVGSSGDVSSYEGSETEVIVLELRQERRELGMPSCGDS